MKHLKECDIVNESKYSFKKAIGRLKSMKHKDYSVDNDAFIREVWCDKKEKYLTVGKKYRLYAEFETGVMISGKCFVVLCDNKEFTGFDSDYFLEEYQWDATKKYNL